MSPYFVYALLPADAACLMLLLLICRHDLPPPLPPRHFAIDAAFTLLIPFASIAAFSAILSALPALCFEVSRLPRQRL